jgi:ABC-type uncharacterized transport system auxiliary subunit
MLSSWGRLHQHFWLKANGEKSKVARKLQKKLELCAQKIFKAFLAYGKEQKAAFLSFTQKAVRKYINEINAWSTAAINP